MELNFKEWLAEIEEKEYNEDFRSLTKNMGNIGRKALLAAPLLMPFMGGQQSPIQQQQQFSIQQQQQNPQSIQLANQLNTKYGTNIQASDIEWIKPEQIIAPMYGDQWGNVKQNAIQAQGPQTIDVGGETINIPTIPNAAITNIEKYSTAIPVVFADPANFGEKQTKGFCTTIGGTKFCVVNNRNNLRTLAHELTHTTQQTSIDQSFAQNTNQQNGKDLIKYFTSEAELGVRIAAMKRDYYNITGQLGSPAEMLKHLLTHTNQYNYDSQQLAQIIKKLNETNKVSFKQIIEFIGNNANKIVGIQGNQTTQLT